jgi:dUTP pyrophosphatase
MIYRPDEYYEIGDKIGQIIFQKLPDTVLLEVDELDDSERGEGGYGSTDNK